MPHETHVHESGILGNWDVALDATYSERYDRLSAILTHEPTRRLFREYDERAKFYKFRYHVIALAALVLGVVAIEFEILSLFLVSRRDEIPRGVGVTVRGLGLVAIILVVIVSLWHLRSHWTTFVYRRERLRQWRHQLLLDGALLDMAPADQQRELEARFNSFVVAMRESDGGLPLFLRREGTAPDLFYEHSIGLPRDPVVRAQLLDLQATRRLDYQTAFAAAKIAPGGSAFSLWSLGYVTDWLATLTLGGAVIAAAAAFFIELGSHPAIEKGALTGSGRALTLVAAVAAALAILSAGVRALRAGLTIPDEQESYAEYERRMVVATERFRATQSDHDRLAILRDVELEAAEELRRFLRIKQDSRFVL